MPRGTITLGELHTAFLSVISNGPVTTKRVGTSIQSSDTRAGNALRQLEEAGLVTSDGAGKWVTNLTPEEANGTFDSAFPGLTTITKQPTQPTPKHKEPTMATATKSEYTKDNSKITGTKFEQ